MDNCCGIEKTKDWEIRLRGVMGNLGAKERRFAKFLLENAEKVEEEPLADIAQEAGVSETTVVRLCHRIGYSGLKELKIVLAKEKANAGQPHLDAITNACSTAAEKVFFGSIRALQDTLGLIDNEQVKLAATALCKATHIVVYAIGGSVPVANSFKHQFMKLGIISNIYNEFQPVIMAAEKFLPGDVAIAISNSGKTPGVVAAMENAKRKGAVTICITSYGNSPLAECSDIRFFTTAETLLNGRDHSLGRVAETAIVDLLYYNVALKYEELQDDNAK